MRIIDDFEDSSDDEEIVEKNPYRKLSRAKKKDMKVRLKFKLDRQRTVCYL